MVEKSVFNESTMTKFIWENYGIKVTDIKKIARGSANLYVLNSQKYVVKEYLSTYQEEDLKREVRVVEHLRNKKIPTPEFFLNMHHKRYSIYKGHYIVLEEFIEGYTKENHTLDLEELTEVGRLLGQIIVSLEDLKHPLPVEDPSKWFSPVTIEQSITKYEELIKSMPESKYQTKIIKDLRDKIKILRDINGNIPQIDWSKITYKNTHGDYNALQLMYKEGKIKAVLDFATACNIPIVWEIIRSYSLCDKEAINGNLNLNNLNQYIQIINNYISLTTEDIKCMPYLYLLQLLHSTYGYKQYLRDPQNEELLLFGFYRTKLCRYLWENAEKMVRVLSKDLKKR